jgi:ABC-type Co2+ transport system permease subunit
VTSVHLLLNGMMGVVLGRRAAVAIPVGVFLQAVLLQHGGYGTMGVNCCVMTLPALVAWQMFVMLGRMPWHRSASFRSALVFVSCLLWLASLVYGVTLLATNHDRSLSALDWIAAHRLVFDPLVIIAIITLAAFATWAERRLGNAAEFAIGLLVGEVAVLLTVLLNVVALMFGGREDWPSLVLLTVVPHAVIAAVEGIVLGFTVAFLARVKPDLLAGSSREKAECTAQRDS